MWEFRKWSTRKASAHLTRFPTSTGIRIKDVPLASFFGLSVARKNIDAIYLLNYFFNSSSPVSWPLTKMAEIHRPAPAGRSDSLASSNASSNGLARRSRIRSRTRTLPGGSSWSDTLHANQQDQQMDYSLEEASEQQPRHLVMEPVHSVPPPRPPRSPQRALFGSENGDSRGSAPRERKASAPSTRSALSNRGANASLQELIDLKNVRCLSVSL